MALGVLKKVPYTPYLIYLRGTIGSIDIGSGLDISLPAGVLVQFRMYNLGFGFRVWVGRRPLNPKSQTLVKSSRPS